MELPKNVTQIGEVGKDCKVYAEDYVVSYMKQLNALAVDKGMAVALYGKRREEDGVTYFFLYGACKVNSLQREVRHLSQAPRQEIEGLRRKYFPEYDFLGYRLLNGEMVEGFHICEQEICRYIAGYAQFYEKNDRMLAYMLDMRDEAEPEQVDQEKYEEVKKRQEERRAAAERSGRSRQTEHRAGVRRMPTSGNLRGMRMAAVGVFALLCLVGLTTFQGSEYKADGKDLQAAAGQWLEQIKDSGAINPSEEAVAANAGAQKDTLVLEDKLEQALLEENKQAQGKQEQSGESQENREQSSPTQEMPAQDGQASEGQAQESQSQETDTQTKLPADAPATKPETVSYVVRKGDTLTRISIRQYGNDTRVADICLLNKISDPDDIKVGQVIKLPQ